MKKILTLLAACCAGTLLQAQEPVFNRAPLNETQYAELPLGAIRAEGWLLDQLERMASGMTGHLDELYPEVLGDDNAWIGGTGDTWERGPYWIDGLLPLAYILGDKTLQDKALRWVEAMLTTTYEDGYFGNRVSHPYVEGLQRGKAEDWWPKMVALKILKQYYMATGDQRVLDVMTGYFRYQLAHLGETPLDHWSFWGKWRGGDNLEMVWWLYNITGEPFLLELGKIIHNQTIPFTKMFTSGAELYTQNSVHCVNLAQGFKEPVVWWQFSRDETDLRAPEHALGIIRHTIGFPTGLWAGDEHIHFGDPARGSELCTAVEMMYSLEGMLRVTGNNRWADHLERIAYNALPTQATDAYDARQYFQQVNQIACTRERRNFVTEHWGTDVVYGLLTGYPCCTCNMHQGWPKLVQNLWYTTADEGLAALVYGPSSVTAKVAGGIEVRLTEETAYPFEETVRIHVGYTARRVKEAEFPLYIRIPEWCRDASILLDGQKAEVDCRPGETVRLQRKWRRGAVITLCFPMEVETEKWYDDATVITRGPLLYALQMEENWQQKAFLGTEAAKYGKTYYEVTSTSPWNYAFSARKLKEKPFEVTVRPTDGSYPWNVEHAPVSIRTEAVILKDWKAYNGSVGAVSYFKEDGKDTGETAAVTLIPYGCTTLRICCFPTRR